MKNPNMMSLPPITRPPTFIDAFIANFEYEAPLGKVYYWLGKLIVYRIHQVDAIISWYDAPYDTSEPLLSKIFDQSDNRLTKRFTYFSNIIYGYQRGHAPKYMIDNIKDMTFELLNKLRPILPRMETFNLLKRKINEFHLLITNSSAATAELMTLDQYKMKITQLTQQIIAIFLRLSHEFADKEDDLLGRQPNLATKSDIIGLLNVVKETAETVEKTAETVEKTAETTEIIDFKTNVIIAKQEHTRKAVNRIDERDKRAKHNKKQRFTYEQRDFAWNCWELARNNANLKLASGCNKVTHGQAFDYYRKDLASVGILTLDDFCSCLKTRNDRIVRHKHQ